MNARQRAGRAGQAVSPRVPAPNPRHRAASPARRRRQGEAEAARCGVTAAIRGVPGRAAAVRRLGLGAPPEVSTAGGCRSAGRDPVPPRVRGLSRPQKYGQSPL